MEERAEVGLARLLAGFARHHPVQQVQHVTPSRARRDDGVDLVTVEQCADAIAVPGQQPREDGDELRPTPRA